MRSGPSTGQPTYPAQGDVMQARWGTHGDHEIIALYPNSVQETLSLTVKAFNLAEKYRNPVILLMDAELSHLRERLEIPDAVEVFDRVMATIDVQEYHPYRTGFTKPGSKVPEFAYFGSGYNTNVTGLTHDERGFPMTNDFEVHKKLVERINSKIRQDVDKLSLVEEHFTKDAEIGVISYGVTSRAALQAVEIAREKGIKMSHLRLISLWPFPEKVVSRAMEKVERIYVPELNLGQMCHRVREATCKDVISIPKIGGQVFNPEEILEKMGVGT
jgi:2-oxoglutarate ferredoxin oxidoreductase subunit alpha